MRRANPANREQVAPRVRPAMSDTTAPIGFIDSGVGGLTVARAVMDQLPQESIWYIGDTARGPYGSRPLEQVRAFSLELMAQLVEGGVKALVIACNTASAAVLRDARSNFSVPVFEVIVPAVRRAAAVTRTGKVGVIATTATVSSGAYEDAFAANPNIEVLSQACPEFVRLVESGVTAGDEVLSYARQYLEPLLAEGIDTLVLGCTHYPFLSGVIQYVVGDHVTLVSSAEETAKDLYRGLLSAQTLAPTAEPTHRFDSTGDREAFDRLATRFLRTDVRRR